MVLSSATTTPLACPGSLTEAFVLKDDPLKEKAFNPIKSRIRAVRLNQLVNMAVTCRLCEDPSCVAACPRDALKQDEETGTIIIDTDKCNGCGWCIEACDYGAMMLHPQEKTVYVCDLCKEQGEPQCVKWCPEEALTVVTSDVLAQKARLAAIKKLFQQQKKQ